MPNSQLESIRQRLQQTRRRQNRLLALTQLGYWVLGASVLLVSLLSIANVFAVGTTAGKILFVGWALALVALTLGCTLRYLRRRQSEARFAHLLEERLPDLEQRLITSLEFENKSVPGVSQQFIDQLYIDANKHVSAKPLDTIISRKTLNQSLGLAGGAVAATIALLMFSGPFLDAGRHLLWPWDRETVVEVPAPRPTVALHVEPGDVSLQRGDDMTVIASIDNATGEKLALYFQDDNLNWQQLTMLPEDGQPLDGGAHVFTVNLSNLSQELEYYVEYVDPNAVDSDPVRSPQYQVKLFDLPRVEGLTAAFDFPAYTGMENKVEDPGGDVVAPEGTQVALTATLNKRVASAQVEFDNGTTVPLDVTDLTASGSFTVAEDTNYRIRLVDANEFHNKDPLDYYVRVIKDTPPEITLRAPGRDQRVMPLEEVPIVVEAKDDYGLTEFELNYSVIGVDDKKVDFLRNEKNTRVQKLDGKTVVYLEDLNVQPGDVVSYSFSVADNNGLNGPSQVISDIYFLEVIPTDHEFARARAGGGGGGGGGQGQSSALVTTQKDVIAATWKLRNRKNDVSEESFAADGRIIRDSQAEVAERAQMSISRLTERGSYDQENYDRAVIALQQAIQQMESAITELDQLAMDTALQAEQRALQEILKAESQINKTDVAMNRQGGGGGMGQQNEREDLRELFEMELGQLENRYEMPQGQQQQGSQAQNELLDKLKELARRQERLTRSQRDLARRENQMNEEQKRQQLEQLRRQQEELRQQLSDLRQQMSQQQAQQQSGSPSGQSGQGSAQQQQAQRDAIQQLERAMEQMQQAASSESPGQAAAKSQKALDSLRQQAEQLGASEQQSVADLQESVQEQTDALVQRQRELRESLEELSRQQSLGDTRTQTALSGQTDELRGEQQALREALDGINKSLREIATKAGDGESRAMERAHDLSRSLRPIQDKMETSGQILDRGMVNLSLKIESEIETALADLQRQVAGIGGAQPQSDDELQRQVAQQVRNLRQELENLQQQAEQYQQGDQQQGGQQQDGQQAGGGQQQANQNQAGGQQGQPAEQGQPGRGGDQQTAQNQAGGAQQPDQIPVRQGERSGAGQEQRPGGNQGAQDGQVSRRELQESLERSRQIADGLVQMGRGGNDWTGNARSIRSELTRQGLEEFLNRPDLLRNLLQPVIELENQLRVQSQLNEIDNKLYTSLDDDVPEEYKTLVETYYRVLSESQRTAR